MLFWRCYICILGAIIINSDLFIKTKDMLRGSTLDMLRAVYVEYSNDWDAKGECKRYETQVNTLSQKPKNIFWAREVYTLRDKKLSARAEKYFSLNGKLAAMVAQANGISAEYDAECRSKAKALDETLDSFDGILTDERIHQARAFVKSYSSVSEDVLRFCRKATKSAMCSFEVRLDNNQKENGFRSKAAALSKRFAELTPIKRNRAYFATAYAFIKEIRSTSSEIMRFSTITSQAMSKFEADIKTEKRYLEYEEQIDGLSKTKAHTMVWCEKVRNTFSQFLKNIDKCSNGQMLRKMRNQADEIELEIICEPYIKALAPGSDFKYVFELDKGLSTYEDREKLYKGIDSFETKWKQRLELAHAQALHAADTYYEQACQYYKNRNYTQSYPLFVEADKYGNAKAALRIGEHYYFGQGIAKDETKAISFFKKAAYAGSSVSMSYLADIYYDKKEYTEAFLWRKNAVDTGYFDDRMKLAGMYYTGTGTTQNYSEARMLYETLVDDADDGDFANYSLGCIYENGLGVTKDEQRACDYYECAQNIPDAKRAYDRLFSKLDGEKRDREITEMFEKAKAGDPWAQYFIGRCYYTGYRCQQHYPEALKWLEKAAAGGVGKAMSILGDMYANGEGVSSDPTKAMKYYKDAIAHGEQ